MPLDFVGKLHRTVYICNCAEEDREDLLRLLLKRCGSIEAWDALDSDRLAVIFAKMDSLSNALSFHGLSFINLETPLVVWKATEAPPPEASTQLTITSTSSPGGGELGLIPTTSNLVDITNNNEEENARRQARREARQQRLAAIQNTFQAEAARCDYTNPAIRAAKLREMSFRQLKALCVLTKAEINHKQEELASRRNNLVMIDSLLKSMTSPKVKS
ncbi:unnamed protein product [Phytomonas sp. Hart1]|nr:unnamed protein product [Phytomonas sp. Hart1]|eukprot:CCW70756.1 unnamed protein product [Phytomonas sp. isolate Hart1]